MAGNTKTQRREGTKKRRGSSSPFIVAVLFSYAAPLVSTPRFLIVDEIPGVAVYRRIAAKASND
jgi:hypothetical protein